MNDLNTTVDVTVALVVLFCVLFVVFLLIIPLWKIFTKAKKPGIACIVPVWKTLVLLQIIKKPWWWIFLMILVLPIWGTWAMNLLGKQFGKNELFTLGMLFLPFIFLPILGYGNAKYKNLEKY